MKATVNQLKISLFFVLYGLFYAPGVSAQTLSPMARVSVLTVAPGPELYSAFGHTVLRIQDPVLGLDRPYSYGTFDFRTENFYLKFIRGTLPYTLSVSDLSREMQYWAYENRAVTEQTLRLSTRQKQQLFDALETNHRPENREYLYKFYFDNCTSRIRDQLSRACADSLTIVDSTARSGLSYRDAMNNYLRPRDWERFGMNLALGRPSDREMTAWQQMYLPENLMTYLRRAAVRLPNGQTAPVVAQELTLVQASDSGKASNATPFFAMPWFVFAALLVLVWLRSAADRRRGTPSRWLDRLIFSVYGLAGWFLFLLWIGTDHGVTNWNPVLLLFFPFYLPLIFRATRPGPAVAGPLFFRASWGLLGGYLLTTAGFWAYDYLTFAPGKTLFGVAPLPGVLDFFAYCALVGILAVRLHLHYPFFRFFQPKP